jgi:hypothetical protein
VAPVELGEHWPWPLTPLLGRAVAAWYALFGTMLLSCAYGMRRPAEALIPYATLACWCVLLLLLPVLHPDDVSGAGLWIALMVALTERVVVRAGLCPSKKVIGSGTFTIRPRGGGPARGEPA